MDNELQHLITMANQIASNNRRETEQACATIVHDHISRFWARAMKQKLLDHFNSGNASIGELHPCVSLALSQLTIRQFRA